MQASPFSAAWREVKLRPVFLALGDAMTLLITLDTIVRNNRMVSRRGDWHTHSPPRR